MSNFSNITDTTPPTIGVTAPRTDIVCLDGTPFILPALNESQSWSWQLRMTLYFLGILWFAIGIWVTVGRLMSALEVLLVKVSRRTTLIEDSDLQSGAFHHMVPIPLLLCAPQILLSIIEACAQGYRDIGLIPGLVTGLSSTYSILAVGLCIFAVPLPDTRRITNYATFTTSSIAVIFGFAWLYLMTRIISPGEVEIWEAIVLFLLYPVVIGFCAVFQRGVFSKVTAAQNDVRLENGQVLHEQADSLDSGVVNEKTVVAFLREIGKNLPLTDLELAHLCAARVADNAPHSRSWYQSWACHVLTGQERWEIALSPALLKLHQAIEAVDELQLKNLKEQIAKEQQQNEKLFAVIGFEGSVSAIFPGTRRAVTLIIKRTNNLHIACKVNVSTVEGSARPNEDFKPRSDQLYFDVGEVAKEFILELTDHYRCSNRNEHFFAKLSTIVGDQKVKLGMVSLHEIRILNSGELTNSEHASTHGRVSSDSIEFSKPCFVFRESVKRILVPVERISDLVPGTCGKASVRWQVSKESAEPGKDFGEINGHLVFPPGLITRHIDIMVGDDMELETRSASFKISMFEATGGCRLGHNKSCLVTIVEDDSLKKRLSRICNLTNDILAHYSPLRSTWLRQIRRASSVRGGDYAAMERHVTSPALAKFGTMKLRAFDYVAHFFAFFWKVLEAVLIPPSSLWFGVPALVLGVVLLGLQVTLWRDLAIMFGCGVVVRPETIAGILMGTLLVCPDLLAGIRAIRQERSANVGASIMSTVSLCNVSLPIGLYWGISAISYKKTLHIPLIIFFDTYVSFGAILLIVFITVATVALFLRRHLFVLGFSEFGGTKIGRLVFGGLFILMWLAFVTLMVLFEYGVISPG